MLLLFFLKSFKKCIILNWFRPVFCFFDWLL